MEKELKALDAQGQEFVLSTDDFSLVQSDVKIHDQKFESKPTTFIKDAFKRFCKNKSSVVAAIIIGIIVLMSLIVPLCIPYDTEGPHPSETFIEPKLFEAGTGFWDGTKNITGIAYDEANEVPMGDFKKEAIVSITVYEVDGIKLCDFVYDTYADKYGVVAMEVPNTYLNRYSNEGPSSFERLDDQCPIMEIIDTSGSKVLAKVSLYRYLGYSSMPLHLFGTDGTGRDLVKRAFIGLRYSLVFAIVIAAICFLFGLVWGSVSGYFGGNVDLLMERFMDILGGVPMIIVVTLCRLHLGDDLWVFGMALCLTGWMGTASRTRTQFYRFKGREYVLASRTLGASDRRLIFRHILPNALGTIVTSTVLMIPSLIFTEASLAYLGLGLQGSSSFGALLSDNQVYLKTQPALILFPAVIISLLMISFNLFGNGLRDALNPSLKGSD